MPCTYTGSIEGDIFREEQERAQNRVDAYARTIRRVTSELDMRERMLCAICTEAERKYGKDSLRVFLEAAAMNAEGLDQKQIIKWWKSHKLAEGRD